MSHPIWSIAGEANPMLEQAMAQAFSRRTFLGLGGAVGAAFALPSAAWAKKAAPLPNLMALCTSYVNDRKVAGMLAMIGRGGDPEAWQSAHAGALAFGSKTAPSPDSLWRIYSMTKPITGMAAMALIGEGKMKLDQPIADMLPEFANMKVATNPKASLDGTAAKTQITVRQLLTHTSGLSYLISAEGALRNAYMRLGLNGGPLSKMPIAKAFVVPDAPSLKDWSERIASLPLIAEPGTKWHYSASLDVLGRVIEVVTGKDFGDYLVQDFIAPMGMDSTYFQVPKAEASRFSDNYMLLNGFPVPVDLGSDSVWFDKPNVPYGGGGLVSSARDYDRFLAMLLNDGVANDRQIMHPDMIALGTSNLLPEGVSTKGTMIEGSLFGAGGRVGTGLLAGSYGWGGAAGTLASIMKTQKVRATLMTQYMPAEAYPMVKDFGTALMADLR